MATKLDEDGLCDCDFDPYPDERDEESWHYLRTCEHCAHQWFGLHCVHDGYQNPCPKCGVRPTPVPEVYAPKEEAATDRSIACAPGAAVAR